MMTNERMVVRVDKLVARLRNDRYSTGPEDSDLDKRHRWNAVMDHVELVIVPQLVREEQMLAALRECRDAKALDMRLRDALVFDHRRDSEGGILKSTPSNGREKPSASKAPSSSVSRESGAETVGGDRSFLVEIQEGLV